MTAGLILFAHGARDPAWAEPLLRLKRRIAQRMPLLAVEVAFLEIMLPDLAGATSALLTQSCTSVTIVPVFLGQGGHVRGDLAALAKTLREAHPNVEIRISLPVGEDDHVLDALAEYCLRTLGQAGNPLPPA